MNKTKNSCIYTRDWVARFLLDCCGYTAEKNLMITQIVEPSCGDGSFTTEIVKRICASAKTHMGVKKTMRNCLRAYDVSENAISQAKARARAVLNAHGYGDKAEELLDNWFVVGDFVTANVGKADFVVGNPPYVRAVEIPDAVRNAYVQKLQAFTRGTDLYIAFLEQGLCCLKPNGKLCFLCSDRWQKNQFGAKFRELLVRKGYHVSLNLQLHEADVFAEKVSAYPAITMIQRTRSDACFLKCGKDFSEENAAQLLKQLQEKALPEGVGAAIGKKAVSDYEKLPLLEEAGVSLGIGIATGKDSVFVTQDPDCVEADRLLPLAYAKDITACAFPQTPGKWLVNPWKRGKLVDLKEYPKLQAYFVQHEEELRNRYIASQKPEAWYRTIDKVKEKLSRREKLLIRDIAVETDPIYENGQLYPHHNLYWMTSDIWDLKVLGGILLSGTVQEMSEWNSVRMRGGALRNQAQYLRKLRIPTYESIGPDQRKELKSAFVQRDRRRASAVCEELYRRE